MGFILDGSVYMAKLVEIDYDVSLRIDEAHKNTIPFQKMGVSE
jgi:hypothetical protein